MENTNILKFRNDKWSVTMKDVICKIEHSSYAGKIEKNKINLNVLN